MPGIQGQTRSTRLLGHGLWLSLTPWNVRGEWGTELCQTCAAPGQHQPGLPQHRLAGAQGSICMDAQGFRDRLESWSWPQHQARVQTHTGREQQGSWGWASGLLGLSKGQLKGGRRRAGNRARSWTQARTEHCQTEKKKLRIVMWAIPGEEAWHILNPHCVLGKAKHVLVSKHNWPNFIALCTSYLQQPAQPQLFGSKKLFGRLHLTQL